MPQIGQELASVDFESLIGGPLNAVIKAQAQATLTTVDFIRSVGFEDEGEGNPAMVSFNYNRPVEVVQPDGSTELVDRDFELQVPLLAMVPLPYIRIATTDIEFNAKITSAAYSETSSQTSVGVDLDASARWGFGSADLKASFSYSRNNTSGNRIDRTYTMNVKVHAVADEMPAGTERLLSILENIVQERQA